MARKKRSIEVEPAPASERAAALEKPFPPSEPHEEEEAIVVEPAESEIVVAETDDVEELATVELQAIPDTEVDSGEPEEPLPAARTGVVLPYDPLSAYLRDISRFAPLSREEEHSLAIAYKQHQDRDAAYKLVASNLWLVVKVAREYERAAKNLLDLIQEGNIGLMEAVKNFDPLRGVRLPSYAVWWIKAYIVRYLIANWRLVKIGTTQAQRKLFFNLKKEKEKLEREGFFPTPKLLAEKLDVKESEVVEMEQRLGAPDVSVDAPLQPDSEGNLLGTLSASTESLEDSVGRREMQQLLAEGLKAFRDTLKEKERIIFDRRMLTEEKATLQEISDTLHVSRERVRQIENRIREKAKAFLQERLGSALEHLEF